MNPQGEHRLPVYDYGLVQGVQRVLEKGYQSKVRGGLVEPYRMITRSYICAQTAALKSKPIYGVHQTR